MNKLLSVSGPIRKILPAVLVVLVVVACSQDHYEKGEGNYSSLKADFGEAHARSDKMVDYVMTDDGERIDIPQPFTKSWIETPDSLYRSMVYYKGEGQSVEVVSLSRVSVIDSLLPADSLGNRMKTDPLTFESMWVSKNKRFLNVGFYLKTGATDSEEAFHHLGLVSDTLITWPDGKRTLCTRLYHDQGGVPEYYSERSYFSLLLSRMQADSIQLTINTYKGEVVKCLGIR